MLLCSCGLKNSVIWSDIPIPHVYGGCFLYIMQNLLSICDYQAPETKPPVEKAPKKVKAAEKKGKTVEVVKEEPLDPVAEKLRQQR